MIIFKFPFSFLNDLHEFKKIYIFDLFLLINNSSLIIEPFKKDYSILNCSLSLCLAIIRRIGQNGFQLKSICRYAYSIFINILYFFCDLFSCKGVYFLNIENEIHLKCHIPTIFRVNFVVFCLNSTCTHF